LVDPRSLARHLRQCREGNRPPKVEAAEAKLWFLALQELIRRGALEEATFAAPYLSSAFPGSIFLERLSVLLAHMPGAIDDPAFTAFVDRDYAQVQIVPRAGATTLLVAFCGRHGSLGLPIPIAHRWFSGLGTHVVYLRDPTGSLYADGLPELANDRAGSIRALQAIAGRLGATQLACYGNSNGGFAALLYGLEMDATAVLATNAVTIFPTDFVVSRLGRHVGGQQRDDLSLVRSYAAAARRPRVHLVYGADNAGDAASAASLAAIDGVTTEAVAGCDGHDAHVALIERGRFAPLLREFAARLDGPDP